VLRSTVLRDLGGWEVIQLEDMDNSNMPRTLRLLVTHENWCSGTSRFGPYTLNAPSGGRMYVYPDDMVT
jgi:hypothetical protein